MGNNALRILPLWAMTAAAQSAPPPAETYAIVQSYSTASTSSDGSESSSHGSDALREQVIARRDGGIERTFDLPADTKPADRARQWQFPARVFSTPGQSPQLLNGEELVARRDRWLATGKLTKADCGRWIFTWNAFQIECDPQSVVAAIEAIDLASQLLAEGALYRTTQASAPLRLVRDGAAYQATGPVDPDKVRRDRAETDVIVARISGKPKTPEDALRTHATDQVSGTVSVRFETGAQGMANKRATTTVIDTRYPDGRTERETATRTVERRRLTANR